MSLYQQYRPHRFSDVLGQDTNINILKSQAKTQHFHHAYMFFGPSGTGKTTTARILAMATNCEVVDGGEPCGKCQSCDTALNSRHWDIMEIDGARFRGIDDVKDLAFKAHFAPLGKHKVYIIDECHMLTEPAWNGMLKLLEEPPPHLIIILCTTQLEKIPDTVTSRCQLFAFTKIPDDVVCQKLSTICQGLGVTPNPQHLKSIAMQAGGNLRRAENTLEQICQIGR